MTGLSSICRQLIWWHTGCRQPNLWAPRSWLPERGISDFSAAEMAVAGKEDLTKFDEIYCYKVTGHPPARVLCTICRPPCPPPRRGSILTSCCIDINHASDANPSAKLRTRQTYLINASASSVDPTKSHVRVRRLCLQKPSRPRRSHELARPTRKAAPQSI